MADLWRALASAAEPYLKAKALKYGSFEPLIAGAGGTEDAAQQIDALRTGSSAPYLQGLSPEDRAQFDRYVQGANLDAQNPGVTGMITKAAAIPLAAGYELGKLYPPALNALSRLPGFGEFAVDETTSPPSLDNVMALGAGMFRGAGRDVSARISPEVRAKILRELTAKARR